jgi:hypothetical protein
MEYTKGMEKKRPYLRRFAAWILDNFLILGLIWFGTTWFVTDRLNAEKFFDGFLSVVGEALTPESNRVMTELRQVSPSDLEQLNRVFRHQFIGTFENFNELYLDQIDLNDLSSLPILVVKSFNQTIEKLGSEAEFNNLSPQLRQLTLDVFIQIRNILEQLKVEKLLLFLWNQFKQFILLISLIPAAYFLLEGLTGRSVGKLLLGLMIVRQTKTHEQTPADVVNLALRWLFKSSGWLVFAIGLSMENGTLLIIATILSVVFSLGHLLILDRAFQVLYDMLSGTGVAVKKSLEMSHLA